MNVKNSSKRRQHCYRDVRLCCLTSKFILFILYILIVSEMIVLRRCCFLTRSFYSLHQSTTLSTSLLTSPKICDFKFSSIDNSYSTNQMNEADTTINEEDRKLKYIQLEISLLRERGGRAPDVNLIKRHHWDELLTLKTTTSRHKFYAYLFLAEKAKENKEVSGMLKNGVS